MTLTDTLVSNKQPPSSEYSWKSVLHLAMKRKRSIVLANLIALFAALCNIPVPLLMPIAVDEVLLNSPGPLINTLNSVTPSSWHGPALYILCVLLLSVALRALSVFFSIIQAHRFTLIAKETVFVIRKQLLQRLQFIPMSTYETLGNGKVVTHLVTDLETLDQFIGTTISKFLVAILSIVGTAAVLLWMHWQLALFILILNPCVIYLTIKFGKRVKQLKYRESRAFELFQQSLAETLTAIQQIRASNRETYYLNKLVENAQSIQRESGEFSWRSDAAARLSFFVFVMGFDIFRAIAMCMVVFSDLTIGEMLAVFGYLWFMMVPVQEVLNIQYAFYSAKAALQRINELATLHQEKTLPGKKDPFTGKPTVSIRCEKLRFGYHPDHPVINDVTFTIEPGEKVAFTGMSGGGKSTLIQLLIGLYTPQNGHIFYDNTDVTEIGFDTVRENVTTVLQQPILFDDTVRNNLCLGKQYTSLEIEQALSVAQLHETITSLPDGLETRLGQSGIRLSGGQRQRLAIARMVLSKPSVVIMDESTSALDTETESSLYRALQQFLSKRTTIIIAHRPSAIQQADRVLHFVDGNLKQLTTEQAISAAITAL